MGAKGGLIGRRNRGNSAFGNSGASIFFFAGIPIWMQRKRRPFGRLFLMYLLGLSPPLLDSLCRSSHPQQAARRHVDPVELTTSQNSSFRSTLEYAAPMSF